MPKLIGYLEAAKYLNLTVHALYTKVARKQIPHVRLSERCVRFDCDRLEEWIRQNTYEPEHTPDGE